MNFITAAKTFWNNAPRAERILLTAVGLLVAAIALSGWIDSIVSNYRVKKAEATAATAGRQAEEYLRKATVVAVHLREKEIELKAIEVKQNEKRKELDKANKQTSNARADYDRTLREPVDHTPSTSELCADLAGLGYPCR